MAEEVRPRISPGYKQEVENIHYLVNNEQPDSFDEALATTCSFAYEAIEAGLGEGNQQIIPDDWKSSRLTDAHIQIIDEELPGSWKDSKLVAERIQSVVWHYLKASLNNTGPTHLADYQIAGDKNSTRVLVKNAMEATRLRVNADLSLSAIRSVCHQRVYGDIEGRYADAFRDDLENIERRVQEQGLGVPTGNE
ncbi:hypothetical protein [Halorubrum aethiopicum]|uniref:hypothetical protein n=1 Tax=Halorubrum aethiopicum TaxID=1758255 RepID=UPI0012FEE54B|nr:hypothetical protein [Halorubrum aethiopicum]